MGLCWSGRRARREPVPGRSSVLLSTAEAGPSYLATTQSSSSRVGVVWPGMIEDWARLVASWTSKVGTEDVFRIISAGSMAAAKPCGGSLPDAGELQPVING